MTPGIIIALWLGMCVGAILAGHRWHAMKPFSQHESNRFPYDAANDARVRGGASVEISHLEADQ